MNSLQNLLAFAVAEPAQTGLLVLGIYAAMTAVLTAIVKSAASRGEAFDEALESALAQRKSA